MQKLIKCVGPVNLSQEDGEDILAGTRYIPGFLFGFVDTESKGYRVVSFHTDSHPDEVVKPGKGIARVKATFQ